MKYSLSWKNYSKSQIIAMNAVLCALVLTFVFFPVSIGVLSLAVIPLIAVVIAAELFGFVNGMLMGLFFGLCSLISHFVRPGVLSFAFYNPLVSIVPRVLIGLTSYFAAAGVHTLFMKIAARPTKEGKEKSKFRLFAEGTGAEILASATGALVGVLTNTIGVLGIILAFYFGTPIGSSGSAIGGPWLTAVIVSNSILEVAVCTVVTPPIVLAVKKIVKKMARK